MLQDNVVMKNCGVELIVRCFGEGDGDYTEVNILFPASAVHGLSLSKVGTALQRQVYEALRQAYSQFRPTPAGKNSA